MIRVLMCLNCCSASTRAGKPAARKLSGQPTKINNGNIVDASNFKSLKVFGTDVSRDEPDTTTTRNSAEDIRAVLEGIASDSRLVLAFTSAHNESFDGEPELQQSLEHHTASTRPPKTEAGYFGETKSHQERAYNSTQNVGVNNRSNSPSTTRIGDYARIEYSPVARSQSSSPGSVRHSGQSTSAVAQEEPAKTTTGGSMPRAARLERRQGFESSSISIASQLSSEMEKNLTNILESSNSPVPIFGTIGLPLGPMAGEFEVAEVGASGRTEAALTSGSQESLSDRPKSQSTSAGFGDSGAHSSAGGGTGGGAALTGAESAEESEQQPQALPQLQPQPSQQVSKQSLETSITSKVQDVSGDTARISSSMNSTISSSLTNPTPTPSELSGTSSSKRRRLTAKGLLKKLKPSKSKKRTSSPVSISAAPLKEADK